MNQKEKKTSAVLLCVMLAALLFLAACAKENKPGMAETTVPNAATTAADAIDTTTEPDLAAPAASVDTSMEDYALVCVHTEDESAPAFDGGRYSGYDGELTACRYTATLQKNGEAEPVFDIVIATDLPAVLAEGGFDISGMPLAKYGEKWLIKVHCTPDDDDSFYIYDAASPSLCPLGEYGSVLFVGERLFLTPTSYSGRGEQTALLFDWDGKIVTSFPEVFEVTLCDDAVYMLRQYDPCVLDMVPVSRLTDASQVPEAERVCEFGRYGANFYEGDKLVIQPLAGGYPTVCPIADAVATLRELTEIDEADQ